MCVCVCVCVNDTFCVCVVKLVCVRVTQFCLYLAFGGRGVSYYVSAYVCAI